jgi:flagellar biosynthetic protein FliR
VLQELVAGNVYAFIVIFCRFGAAMMSLPGVGEASVSPRIRLTIALLMTGVSVPILAPLLPPLPAQPVQLAVLVVSEIGFGLALGLLSRLVFSALHVGGTVIAMQAGLSSAVFFDPNQGSQSALVSSAMILLGVTLVFVTNLHLMALQAAYDSYTLFPPMQVPAFGDFAEVATHMVSGSIALGIKLAAPFIVYGIVFNVALGLLNRLMPQLQIFFIMQAPLIALALVLLGLSLTAMGLLFTTRFEALMSQFLVPR